MPEEDKNRKCQSKWKKSHSQKVKKEKKTVIKSQKVIRDLELSAMWLVIVK